MFSFMNNTMNYMVAANLLINGASQPVEIQMVDETLTVTSLDNEDLSDAKDQRATVELDVAAPRGIWPAEHTALIAALQAAGWELTTDSLA